MTISLAPLAKQQFNQNGIPLAGGQLFTYAGGTTTKLTTYANPTGTPNTNPIVLDANGQCEVYLTDGVLYKFVLAPATDTDPPTNPFWTVDSISSVGSSVNSSALAAGTGAQLIGYEATGSTYNSNVFKKLNETLSVKDFGAVGDGTTDDSAAFQAASNYAATLTYVLAGQNVEIVVPPGKYRIGTTIDTFGNVGWIGYGASLIGPITAYPRVTGATAVPGPTDTVGQCGGACFSDNLTNSTLYYARFEGLDFNNYRWGFVSACFAWYEPQIVNCNFSNCDGMFMAYQGCQSANFIDPVINNCYVGFVGAATCFASGNPYVGLDNYFADNVKISGRRSNSQLVANSAFNTWFNAAILRPQTTSNVDGFTGIYTFGSSVTACSPDSRLVYIPQRNNRTTFNTAIKDVIMTGSARGCCFISRPYQMDIDTIAGEGCFLDPVINAAGTTETMTCFTDSTLPITGEIHNVDASYSSIGGVTGGAFNVLTLGGPAGNINASSLYGSVLTPQHLGSSLTNSLPFQETYLDTIRGLDLTTKGGLNSYATVGTYYDYFLAGASHRQVEGAFGSKLPRVFAGGILPSNPATTVETVAYIIWSGTIQADGQFFQIQGSLRVWVRRLDTGVQDFTEVLCTLGGRNSTTTTSAATTTGTSNIPLTTVTVGMGAGSVILMNGDEYVVQSITGSVITLCQPTRANYANGVTVVPAFTIDRTITAFVNGIATVTASPANSAIAITNILGTVPSIEWRAEFTSHGQPVL